MADNLFVCFPSEIIELILESDDLEIRDTVNFGITCKQFNRTVFESNKLWRTKFFQKWPRLLNVFMDMNALNGVSSWLEEVKTSYHSRKALMCNLSGMSQKYYKKQELSDSELQNFDALFRPEYGAKERSYFFLIDELIMLINEPVLQSNLTHRYYAFKVIKYLKQHHLKQEWEKFIALPVEKQLLEKGATIVAQWSQPEKHVLYSQISTMLDEIAQKSKEVLREKYPNHPLFSTPIDKFLYWKENNIDDNQWNTSDTKLIMNAICDIMFNRLGLHGNSEMYYSSENSFIDSVLILRRGIPITLAIIFESISRRLGVKCEPVSFPAHFLLRWKEKYSHDENDDVENYYIDVFNGGQFLTRKNCPRLSSSSSGSKCPMDRHSTNMAATPIEVVERMAANLEVASRQRTHLNGRASRLRSALELLHLVRPYDTNAILHLGRFYMLYQMDSSNLVNTLTYMQENSDLLSRGPVTHIQQMLQDYEKHRNLNEERIEVKKRTHDIKYAIGMIMKHRLYDYLCVITGWDEKCKASPDWIHEMRVEQLNKGANQPFYTVFADDGSARYAAQENLYVASTPDWVSHYEIGRYFNEFRGTYYVPNEEKMKEYPEDAEAREIFFSTFCGPVQE